MAKSNNRNADKLTPGDKGDTTRAGAKGRQTKKVVPKAPKKSRGSSTGGY